MTFAEKLRQLREQKNLTQEDVAKAIGVTRRTYVSYENDGRYPRKSGLYEKLAEILSCELSYLYDREAEFTDKATRQYGSRGANDAEEIVNKIKGMFAGGDLPESDKDAIMKAIQDAYWEAKEYNKRFTPKKWR